MRNITIALAILAATIGFVASAEPLPRFTEEREAAALFFVKKHLPELTQVLDPLKRDHPLHYQREIREIFQVTELLADLADDTARYDIELKIWIMENRAHVLLAKISTPDVDERKKLQNQLQDLAGQLVGLDIEYLEMRAEQLDREIGETREELTKIRENRDRMVKDRYEGLLQKLSKRKK